jgi:hypothetical protein
MPYIMTNLYHDHKGEAFDPHAFVESLKEAFPNVEADPDDQLLVRLRNVEQRWSADKETQQVVLDKMRRDARVQGPALAFTLVLDGQLVEGIVKRQLLQLSYERPLLKETLTQLENFVRSQFASGTQIALEERP